MLHSVSIVKDINETQKFYSDVLGMKKLRYRSFEDGSANGFSGVCCERTLAYVHQSCCHGTHHGVASPECAGLTVLNCTAHAAGLYATHAVRAEVLFSSAKH